MLMPSGSDIKDSACNARDASFIPGWGRSPGEGNGYPLCNSWVENPLDRRVWWATVHGVSKSQTRLSCSQKAAVRVFPGLGGLQALLCDWAAWLAVLLAWVKPQALLSSSAGVQAGFSAGVGCRLDCTAWGSSGWALGCLVSSAGSWVVWRQSLCGAAGLLPAPDGL